MTSRQLSPSPATKRNHSPASLSLQSSCSKDSSFLLSSPLCLFTRIASPVETRLLCYLSHIKRALAYIGHKQKTPADTMAIAINQTTPKHSVSYIRRFQGISLFVNTHPCTSTHHISIPREICILWARYFCDLK